ncbi:IQG1 [Candida oxycetoniae]|uniref:IQG1 n=1 Tax=Candida oxycetoniae TaxID=497107 RepID=A0AAI9T185_9ASCO|nr:IQG1 [Candida oxycetoniae]KAI3406479.2 IQG1 [Candida oxycetoniae]
MVFYSAPSQQPSQGFQQHILQPTKRFNINDSPTKLKENRTWQKDEDLYSPTKLKENRTWQKDEDLYSPTKLKENRRWQKDEDLHSPTKLKENRRWKKDEDLDLLARELNVSPSNSYKTTTNNRIQPLQTAFGSPSATISSFKSSSRSLVEGVAATTAQAGSSQGGGGEEEEETPSWAKTNYRDFLNKSPSRSPTKSSQTKNISSISPIKDQKCIYSPGYEYLCRIEAIKVWMQAVLNEEICQSAATLISYIRNGIHLAKLANAILPTQRSVFMNDDRLQFKHTENINRFFHLLDFLNMPDLFRFELTDLYDAKNVPKVWFCLHVLSYILHKSDSRYPKMGDLVNKISFDKNDIQIANRALTSAPLPNFSSVDTGNDGEDKYMEKVASPIKISPNKKIPMENPAQKQQQQQQQQRQQQQQQQLPSSSSSLSFSSQLPYQKENEKRVSISNVALKRLEDKDDRQTPFINQSEIIKNCHHIVKLQSLARGANFRYSMFVKKILLKSYYEELTILNSIIRGNLSRLRSVHKNKAKLKCHESEIIALQSLVRKNLFSKKKQNVEFDGLCYFQSIIRRRLQVNKISQMKKELASSNIVTLQSIARKKIVDNKTHGIISHMTEIVPPIIQLQAIARRKLYTKHSTVQFDDVSGIVELQSIVRRNFVISEINSKHAIIRSYKWKINELQNIARGGISRSRLCNNVLVTLLHEDSILSDFYAVFRGKSLRRRVGLLKRQLRHCEYSSVLPVQTLFRGVLSRFRREILLDDAYSHVEALIKLQSKIRMNKVKQEFLNCKEYYRKHVKEVIKAQAIIRRVIVQTAYKGFISSNRPSLSVVRKFAYLLADSERDFQEEMKLNQTRDIVIEKCKLYEELESQIESIDLKLSLLDKNKITIDEFSKSRGIVKKNPIALENVKNLKKLNKSSRARVELYSKLLYLLQIKADYWKRLFETLELSTKNTQHYKDLFNCIVQLFPTSNSSINQHSREEYFFMKLILTLMKNDVDHARNPSDITKSQYTFWTDYLSHFNNHTYQRQHLKMLLGGVVIRLLNDEELDFESDPAIIYAALIDRDIKVDGFSTRKKNLTPQEAITVPEVSTTFVKNLMSLREFCNELVAAVEKNTARVPQHIKIICKEAYILSKNKFVGKSEQQHLAVAGVTFFKHYIGAIINIPENYGIVIKKNSKGKNNIRHLHRVLLQLFSMNPFSDSFLKPLNDYIFAMTSSITAIVNQVITVESLERVYDLNEYDDIISTEKPKLTMKTNSMIFLEKLVDSKIDIMAPGSDDQLAAVASDLGNLVTSSDDFVALTDLGMLSINLNPHNVEESVMDTKVKTLFTEAKRCLLYIIRIQDGEDLLELLISGIKPEDETKYKELIISEKDITSDRSRAYHKAALGNLEEITFHELKRKCLENILKLETMGEVTRKNSFQELLNQISVDIRKKGIQRLKRAEQLSILEDTVKKMNNKEAFLRQELKDYKYHVENVLANLQVKPKSRKLFNIVPVFSKQYFYHRELRRRNRLPEFGSYIVSSKKLMDQRILLSNDLDAARGSKLDFMFSCHQVGKFTIEAARGSVVVTGTSSTITLDDLLRLQYENKPKLILCKGKLVFDSQNIIAFIFKTFYDIKKD